MLFHRALIAEYLTGRVATRLHASKAILTAASVCAAGILGASGYLLIKHPSLYNTKLDRLSEQASDVWKFATTGLASFNIRHEQAAARIRADYPLPLLDGTFAVFSSLQTIAMAHPVNYSVLPTTAAQLIWTPKLDAANVSFFDSTNAPKFVAGHLPYTNRRSGLTILENYRPYGFVSDMYLLRRDSRTPVTRKTLGKSTIGWGERIAIPPSEGGVVIVKIQYERTLWGSILNLFYQPAPVYLVTHDLEKVTSRELIGRELAEQGLITSPKPGSVAEFAAMTSAAGRKYMSSREPVSLHLEAGKIESWLFPLTRAAQFFLPAITIEFERLSFVEPSTPAWSQDSAEMAAFERLLTVRPHGSDRRTPPLGLAPGGRPGIELRQDHPLSFQLDPLKNRFELTIASRNRLPPSSKLKIEVVRNSEPPSVQHKLVYAETAGRAAAATHATIPIDYESCEDAENCTARISISNVPAQFTDPVYIIDASNRR